MFIDFKPLGSYIHNLSYLQIIKIGLRIFALKLGKSTTELVSRHHITSQITGHVLHAVLILDDTAPNSLPVPKEILLRVQVGKI